MTRQKWIILAVVFLMMGGTTGLLYRLKSHQHLGRAGIRTSVIEGSPRLKVELPEKVLNYTSEFIETDKISLGALPKDTSFGRRLYEAPDGLKLDLNVVLMGTDRTSIHKPQFCLRGSGLEIRKTEKATVRVAAPQPYDLPVTRLTVYPEKSGPESVSGVYVYWFVADKLTTPDHWQRMWWLFRDVVFSGTLERWAYIYCFAPCAPGQEDALFERMRQFIGAAVPEFQLPAPAQGDAVTAISK